MLAWRTVFFAWVALFGLPSLARGQGAISLDARVPTYLGACVAPDQVQTNYLSALSANGIFNANASRVEAVVRTRADVQPGSALIDVSASLLGRALGLITLRVTPADCAVLPRALGQAVARLVRQTAALDANRPLLPLQDNVLPVVSSSLGTPDSASSDTLLVGVGAGMVAGLLPSAAFALHMQIATTNEPVSLRLRATLLWPQSRRAYEGVIDTIAYDLSLELCGTLRWPGFDRLALRLCLGPRVGIEDASYQALPLHDSRIINLFAYVGLSPEVALRLAGATWLQLGGSAALSVVRPHFILGIDAERRSVELSNPAIVRTELGLSVLQVF